MRLVGDRWNPNADAADIAGTVMLLHGGGQTRHSWHTTAQRLATHGWTAISMDARGQGESQGPPDGEYSIDLFAADLCAIADTLHQPP